MIFSGINKQKKLVEIIEISEHPWFLAVQFHPEFQSKPLKPHPLFTHFISAALYNQRQNNNQRVNSPKRDDNRQIKKQIHL